MRAYEDHVLGRLATDSAFERAAAAVARYQGRDRSRGLAFLVGHFLECIGFRGVTLNPAVVKSLLQESPGELLAEGWQAVRTRGRPGHATTVFGADHCRPAFAPLADSRRRLRIGASHGACRSSATASRCHKWSRRQPRWKRHCPGHGRGPRFHRERSPTFLRDEEAYPVGGFSSISMRGHMESLLHSQLAYMEQGSRPDLFDVKFLRDELLYYSRDEANSTGGVGHSLWCSFPRLVKVPGEGPRSPLATHGPLVGAAADRRSQAAGMAQPGIP